MNLLKALATVGSMTFISRILGFVRDTLIARIFGAGVMTDAFFVAFKIPNLLRRLFAEESDARTIIRSKELYDLFEEAVDSCEDVADVIHGVVLERI